MSSSLTGHCDYESASLSVEVYVEQPRVAAPHRNHTSELPSVFCKFRRDCAGGTLGMEAFRSFLGGFSA